ncbi:hypothetical protein D3C73_826370 [compost metagenome]
MPIAGKPAPTGSVAFTYLVYDAITVGASSLAMAATRSKRTVTEAYNNRFSWSLADEIL